MDPTLSNVNKTFFGHLQLDEASNFKTWYQALNGDSSWNQGFVHNVKACTWCKHLNF